MQQDCTEKITVSGKSLTIDLNGHTYDDSMISVGPNCTITVSGDKIIVTYTALSVPSQPSGGSSSSGSSSSSGGYLVSVESSKNGKVTVTPDRADKGDTVTITVKPNMGYELEKLTVTDDRGKAVGSVSTYPSGKPVRICPSPM